MRTLSLYFVYFFPQLWSRSRAPGLYTSTRLVNSCCGTEKKIGPGRGQNVAKSSWRKWNRFGGPNQWFGSFHFQTHVPKQWASWRRLVFPSFSPITVPQEESTRGDCRWGSCLYKLLPFTKQINFLPLIWGYSRRIWLLPLGYTYHEFSSQKWLNILFQFPVDTFILRCACFLPHKENKIYIVDKLAKPLPLATLKWDCVAQGIALTIYSS